MKDVEVVVRPYKTRDAFSDLTNRVIYLNKYLIDDEEILEYLVLHELVRLSLYKYPPTRYGTPSLSYAEKFENTLYFFMSKEKVEEIRERWK